MLSSICLNSLGLKQGQNIAPFLMEAQEILKNQTVAFSGQANATVWVKSGDYVLDQDVNLNVNGITYDFNNSNLFYRNGATLFIGGPLFDASTSWKPSTVWDSTMPAGRHSFSCREKTKGQNRSLRNYEMMAAIHFKHDWSQCKVFTLDLSFGRDEALPANPITWHDIIGYKFTNRKLAPFGMTCQGPGNVKMQFVVEDQNGARYRDNWSVNVPDILSVFNRKDISIEYTAQTRTLRMWIDRKLVTPVRGTGDAVPGDAILNMASNVELNPLCFPNFSDEGRNTNNLIIHGVRLCDKTLYKPDVDQVYITGRTLNDREVFDSMPSWAQINMDPGSCNGGYWTMRPENNGMTCLAVGTGGRGKARAFIEGDKFVENNFPNMTNHISIFNLNVLTTSKNANDSRDWTIPILFGRALHLNLDKIKAPEGCFNLINAIGTSCYPVKISNIFWHVGHTCIVARFFTPTLSGFEVRNASRALVRCLVSSGCVIEDFFAHPEVHTEGLIIVSSAEHPAQVVIHEGLVNDEGTNGSAPVVKVYATQHTTNISINNIGVGAPSANRTKPLVLVDNRLFTNPSFTETVIGSVLGNRVETIKVLGDTSKVKVKYIAPTDSWGTSIIKYPEDSSVLVP